MRCKADQLNELYFKIKADMIIFFKALIPYFRRIIRFFALPFCYVKYVNWNECAVSKYQVVKDFLYIFFRLKYFPDNYTTSRLWEKDRSEWKYYYGSIYDAYQRARLIKEVQPPEYVVLFEDKQVCYELCKAAGLPLPVQYGYIDPNTEYQEKINSFLKQDPGGKIILKPVKGNGGKDISVAFRENGNVIIKRKQREYPLEKYTIDSRMVAQEFIKQHESLSAINSTSVNTIRIVTMLTRQNKVLYIFASLRMGRKNALIDNFCIGGIAAGINIKNGRLYNFANDSNAKLFYKHPDSEIIFDQYPIPMWQESLDLAKKVQLYFSYYKLLSTDFTITSTSPIIIEITPIPDVGSQEGHSGPVLLNKEVRREFKEYNLLINNLISD